MNHRQLLHTYDLVDPKKLVLKDLAVHCAGKKPTNLADVRRAIRFNQVDIEKMAAALDKMAKAKKKETKDK